MATKMVVMIGGLLKQRRQRRSENVAKRMNLRSLKPETHKGLFNPL